MIDPLVIPDLKKLLAVRATHPELADEAMALYLGRTPDWPFRTREAIGSRPDMDKAIPPAKATQWRTRPAKTDWAQWGAYLRAREQLTINIAKVMADNRLDAIVHKTVEIPPVEIDLAINPPYKAGTNYVPTLNTFLVFAASMTVPSGYSEGGLPTGITFFGPAYSEPTLITLAYAYEQATHHRAPPKTTAAKPMKPRPAVIFCAKICRLPAESSAPPIAQRIPPITRAMNRIRAGSMPTLRAAKGCSPLAASCSPNLVRFSSTQSARTTKGMATTKMEIEPKDPKAGPRRGTPKGAVTDAWLPKID